MSAHERLFVEHVMLDAGLGVHDDPVGSIDIDIVSNIWNRWPANANGGREHVDPLENLSGTRKSSPTATAS